jgi:hypothetical protein
VVVHALNPVYTRWAREALPLARQGMDLAQRLGATFMLPGNVYNFGEGMPPLLEPGTPQRADTAKGRIRVQMEAEMRQRAAQGLRSVVLRAGDFFGGGQGAWLDKVVLAFAGTAQAGLPGPAGRAARLGLPARPGARLRRGGLSHRSAAVHHAALPRPHAHRYAAVGGAGACRCHARPGAGRGWRHGCLPWPLLRAGGRLVPMWRELAEMEYLWRVPHALDGNALQACVGALPVTALDEALRDALMQLGHGAAAAGPSPIQPPQGA